ncbi:MAG TPA: glycerol-3-phosphate dehydrogenase/oxidase [Porticoccaceae bacterium]
MTTVDLAVIGGGIQGVGVAQAAAAAGYSVLLVEKHQLGSGTSSASSKLIHGGLRYLRQGQFRLVRESLRERDILLHIAPEQVRLNHFHIPLYQHTRLRPWQLRIGLSVYALLAGRNPFTALTGLSRKERQSLKGLHQGGLSAVFRYQDAQTDDRKLTECVAHSARQLGATILTETRAIGARRLDDGYALEVVRGSGDDVQPETVYCRAVVNAAGPWINQVASIMTPAPPQLAVELVKGTHLVLEPQLSTECFYLEATEDGRAVFVLPWHGKTLLGTTEVPWHGDPDHVAPSEEEENYLLATLGTCFPDYLRACRVVDRMAGLRVLPAGEEAPTARSRDVRLVTHLQGGSGYLAIYGGKLTGYRLTAQKVIRALAPVLGKRTPLADTARLRLTGEGATSTGSQPSAPGSGCSGTL